MNKPIKQLIEETCANTRDEPEEPAEAILSPEILKLNDLLGEILGLRKVCTDYPLTKSQVNQVGESLGCIADQLHQVIKTMKQ